MDETATRLLFHTAVQSLFDDVKLYFRPPGNLILQYPCIVYQPQSSEPSYALNKPYVIGETYQAILMSVLPGYSEKRKFYDLPESMIVTSNTSYVVDDLVHDVFTITVNAIA